MISLSSIVPAALLGNALTVHANINAGRPSESSIVRFQMLSARSSDAETSFQSAACLLAGDIHLLVTRFNGIVAPPTKLVLSEPGKGDLTLGKATLCVGNEGEGSLAIFGLPETIGLFDGVNRYFEYHKEGPEDLALGTRFEVIYSLVLAAT